MSVRSFACDISPLFTASQIQCMAGRHVFLDRFDYMSDAAGDATYDDHANARHVYARLAGDEIPRMPPGGPLWTAEMLTKFSDWMMGGFQP